MVVSVVGGGGLPHVAVLFVLPQQLQSMLCRVHNVSLLPPGYYGFHPCSTLSHQLLRRESHPVFGWREVPPPNFARLQVLHPLPFLRTPCWRAGCWRHVSPQRGGLPLMLCALLSPGVGVGVPDWLVVGGGCCTATSQPLALRQGPNEVRGAGGMGVARRLVRGLSATTLRLQAQASQAARVPGGVAADGHSLRAFMAGSPRYVYVQSHPHRAPATAKWLWLRSPLILIGEMPLSNIRGTWSLLLLGGLEHVIGRLSQAAGGCSSRTFDALIASPACMEELRRFRIAIVSPLASSAWALYKAADTWSGFRVVEAGEAIATGEARNTPTPCAGGGERRG